MESLFHVLGAVAVVVEVAGLFGGHAVLGGFHEGVEVAVEDLALFAAHAGVLVEVEEFAGFATDALLAVEEGCVDVAAVGLALAALLVYVLLDHGVGVFGDPVLVL